MRKKWMAMALAAAMTLTGMETEALAVRAENFTSQITAGAVDSGEKAEKLGSETGESSTELEESSLESGQSGTAEVGQSDTEALRHEAESMNTDTEKAESGSESEENSEKTTGDEIAVIDDGLSDVGTAFESREETKEEAEISVETSMENDSPEMAFTDGEIASTDMEVIAAGEADGKSAETAIPLTLDKDITIEKTTDTIWYSYTAKEDGRYYFKYWAEYYKFAAVYNSSMEKKDCFTWHDRDEDYFYLGVLLQKGETCYYTVESCEKDDVVNLSMKPDITELKFTPQMEVYSGDDLFEGTFIMGKMELSYKDGSSKIYEISSSNDLDKELISVSYENADGTAINEDDNNMLYTPGKYRVLFKYGSNVMGTYSLTVESAVPKTGITELMLDQKNQVVISEKGGEKWFSFTPEEDGVYALKTLSGTDMGAVKFYENNNFAGMRVDDYSSVDDLEKFWLRKRLIAGHTYYYCMKTRKDTGDYSFRLEHLRVKSASIVHNEEKQKFLKNLDTVDLSGANLLLLYENGSMEQVELSEFILKDPEDDNWNFELYNIGYEDFEYKFSYEFIKGTQRYSYRQMITGDVGKYKVQLYYNGKPIGDTKYQIEVEADTGLTSLKTGKNYISDTDYWGKWYTFTPEKTGFYEFINCNNIVIKSKHDDGTYSENDSELQAGIKYVVHLGLDSDDNGNIIYDIDIVRHNEQKELTSIKFIPERTTYTVLGGDNIVDGNLELTYRDGSTEQIKCGSKEYRNSNIELHGEGIDDKNDRWSDSGYIYNCPGTYTLYFSYYDEYVGVVESDSFKVTVKEFDYNICEQIELGKEYKIESTDKNQYFTFKTNGPFYRYWIKTADGTDAQDEGDLYYYDTEEECWKDGTDNNLTEYPTYIGSAEKCVLKINSGIAATIKIVSYTLPVSAKVRDGLPDELVEGVKVNLNSCTFDVTYGDKTTEKLKIGENDRFDYKFLSGELYHALRNGDITEEVETNYLSAGNYVYRMYYETWMIVNDSAMHYYVDIPITVKSSENGCKWEETGRTEATCTETGIIKEKCTLHGETRERTIPAKDHMFSWITDKNATCINDGSRHKECSVCGYKENSEVIKATGIHQYGSWTTAKAATVFANGIKQRVCSVCGNKETESILKLKATLKLNVAVGKTLPLAVKQSFNVKVSGLAKGDSVKSWKSSNANIVSVNGKGKITGKKVGTAKITVTLKSGLSTWFKVKVQKSAVATTSLTVKNASIGKAIGKSLTLKQKGSIKLAVTVAPATSKQKVTYSTSNKKIVTVNSSGVLKTANKKGTAYITVKSGTKSKKIKVTVK